MTYQQFPVVGPFAGFVDNVPTPHNPPNSFDEIINFLCRKGRVHTRPKLNNFGSPPDSANLRLMKTFLDVENNYHTLALTTQTAYFVTAGAVYNALTLPGGIADLSGTSLPYAYATTNSRVYFSNGSRVILYADGEASLKDSTSPGSARFLTINASHLIAAYTTEPEPGASGSFLFPQRIRWAKSGDPNVWTGFSAGFSDLLDVPDVLTGLATIGRSTLCFRTNGITLCTPTGQGGSPFIFENMSSAPLGVGNIYPYSLAIFDQFAVFIANNDIYSVNAGLSLTAIGGKAKKKIISQLALASGDQVTGWAVAKLGPGIDYLSYWLSIPGQSTWVYHFDEDNWQEFDSPEGRATFIGPAVVA